MIDDGGKALLTFDVVLRCTHGGTVKAIKRAGLLTVDGVEVLTSRSLLGATISGCPQSGPGIKPCTSIASILPGSTSTSVEESGEAILTDSLDFLTDGNPPGTRLRS